MHLEHRYAATLLAALLTGDCLAELGDRIVPARVLLQARAISPVDDVVVEGCASDGSLHRVSVGVRRDPALTASDTKSVPLIRSFLRIVVDHRDEVAEGRWRLCLAVAVSGSGVRETAELARIARSMRSSAAFRSTVARAGATSHAIRRRLVHLDALVAAAADDPQPYGEDFTWRWLAVLRVRQFRLEGADESDRSAVVAALRAVVVDGSLTEAESVFGALAERSGGWAAAGADLDEDLLRRELSGFALRPAPVGGARYGGWPLRVRPANDLGPIDAGVHRAARPTAATAERLGREGWPVDVPPYVPRDFDAEVQEALARGGLVILEGPSASGKTRSALEALQRSPVAWQVFCPADATRLRAETEALARVRNLAVWLDDLERFLSTPDFDEELLSALCEPRDGVVVLLATMRAEQRRTLERRARETSNEKSGVRFAAVARMLGRAAVVRTPRQLSAAEQARAESLRWDTRIAEALDNAAGAGMTEYVCAGPAAVHRWMSGADGGHPVGAAIISAAVDCQRAGYWRPLPTAVLQEAYRSYLDPRLLRRGDTPPFDESLSWAAEAVRGACACLEPMGGDRYSAFDYLVDYAQQHVDEPVPAPVLQLLLDIADPETAYALAETAHEQGLHDIAHVGYCAAGRSGNLDAMFMAGCHDLGQDRFDAGIQWLRQAAERAFQPAMGVLGFQLYVAGQRDEGRAWMQRSASDGDLFAAGGLGITLWHKEQQPSLAEPWLRQALPLRQPQVMTALAEALVKLERPAEALPLLRRAVKRDHAPAMYALASLLFEQRQWEEALDLWRRAADRGDVRSQAWFGALKSLEGSDEAERWLRLAAGQGDEVAKRFLGMWLSKWSTRKARQQLDPRKRLPEFYLTLGDAMQDADDIDRALEYWTIAESFGSAAAAQRIRKLRSRP